MALTQVDMGLLSSTAQYTGFKNRIFNSGMLFWQRGTSSTLSSYGFVADRWSGGQFASETMSQSASAPAGFLYSLKCQRPAGATSTGLINCLQIVESINCQDLSGKTIAISFWVKAGANFSASSSNLGVQVFTGTTADQGAAYPYYSWTGGATPLNTTQAITTTWTKYTVTATLGSGVLELALNFFFTPVGTAGADDSFYITGVQLEEGVASSSYDAVDYGRQLIQCQRYFQKTYNVGTAPGATGGYAGGIFAGAIFTEKGSSAGTNSVAITWQYKTSMRANPTITFYSPATGTADRKSVV